MKRDSAGRINQLGSMMVEAMAMLALISLVTPVIYRKSAERTSELQDINASAEMRSLSTAVDNFVRNNYNDIIAGNTVNGVSFSSLGSSPVQISDLGSTGPLKEYLPQGFSASGDKIFSDFEVVLTKKDDGTSYKAVTAFVIANPKDTSTRFNMRSSRIASMIGSNGGRYTDESGAPGANAISGVQGIWTISSPATELGVSPSNNAVVAISAEPIITQGFGSENNGTSEDVLHRVPMPENPDLNRMFTDLLMGKNSIKEINSMVVQGATGADQSTISADAADGLTISSGASIAGKLMGAGKKFEASDTELKYAGTAGGSVNISAGSGSISINGGTTNISNTDITETATGDINRTANTITDTAAARMLIRQGAGSVTLSNNNIELATSGGYISESADIISQDATTINQLAAGDINRRAANISDIATNSLSLQGNDTTVGGSNSLILNQNNAGKITMQNGVVTTEAGAINQNGNSVTLNAGAAPLPSGAGNDGVLALVANNNIIHSAPQITFDARNTLAFAAPSIVFSTKYGAGGTMSAEVLRIENTNAETSNADPILLRRGEIEIPTTNPASGTYSRNTVLGNERNVIFQSLGTTNMKAHLPFDDPAAGGYDAYQLNPAYTSVMKDIKLTTRGGARLSDILPDFINKEIYIADNNYMETQLKWQNFGSGSSGSSIASCQDTASCIASAWLGFIPTPVCPPGHAKVATITPANFALAQAGTYGDAPGHTGAFAGSTSRTVKDVVEKYQANASSSYLSFQKNTWLRSQLRLNTVGGNFTGWHAIMGFIYPYVWWQSSGVPGITNSDMTEGSDNARKLIWNLFPVYNRTLEAYITTYCYFDRAGSIYNTAGGDPFGNNTSNVIDKYDQLKKSASEYLGAGDFNPLRKGCSSGGSCETKQMGTTDDAKLNDPNLGYTNPW